MSAISRPASSGSPQGFDNPLKNVAEIVTEKEENADQAYADDGGDDGVLHRSRDVFFSTESSNKLTHLGFLKWAKR